MMEIKDLQNKIKEFDKARGWENHWNIKDLMLNMNEEIGELWNLIKWVDDEKQRELVEKNKDEVKDFVGDILFLIVKIANQTKIDMEKSIQDVLNEYERRMPTEVMQKLKHANKKAGGFDDK